MSCPALLDADSDDEEASDSEDGSSDESGSDSSDESDEDDICGRLGMPAPELEPGQHSPDLLTLRAGWYSVCAGS